MSSRNAGSGTHDLSAVWHVCRTNCAPRLCPIKIEGGGTYPDLPLCDGAGEGNRTLMTSLEGWSSAIELRPRARRGLLGQPPGWHRQRTGNGTAALNCRGVPPQPGRGRWQRHAVTPLRDGRLPSVQRAVAQLG